MNDKLTKAEEILKETKKMLDMQKQYFKHRNNLHECKFQEAKVESLIEHYFRQPTLFDQ